MENDLMCDYRYVVLTRERFRMRKSTREILDAAEKKWENANNILEKTLIYELCPACKDVEGYKIVKDLAFCKYNNKITEKYSDADIMNGWWPIFKKIFKIEYRIDKHKKSNVKIEDLYEISKGKKEDELASCLSKKHKIEKEIIKDLFAFLKVVYTIGNISPVPRGCNIRASRDQWEYKVKNRIGCYDELSSEELFLEDYDIENIFEELDDKKYIEDRIDRIIKRGYRICYHQRFGEEELKEIEKIKKSLYS